MDSLFTPRRWPTYNVLLDFLVMLNQLSSLSHRIITFGIVPEGESFPISVSDAPLGLPLFCYCLLLQSGGPQHMMAALHCGVGKFPVKKMVLAVLLAPEGTCEWKRCHRMWTGAQVLFI